MNTLDTETAIGWRGRMVRDRDGRDIGRLEEIYLDRETDRPAWAALHTGLFGLRRTFVPLADARLVGDDVEVPYDEDLVKKAPSADPDVTLSHDEESRLYSHYGIAEGEAQATEAENATNLSGGASPVQESGPATPEDREGSAPADRVATGATSMPDAAPSEEGASVVRSEEELRVGKRQVQSRLRLKKYVVTDQEVVPVRREEVRIERIYEDDDRDAEVLLDTGENRAARRRDEG